MLKLAPQTIEALVDVISGGSGNDTVPPIGIYRSGPKLERYMRQCGVAMSIGSGSRLPTLTAAIIQTMEKGHAEKLKSIVEKAADPRDFVYDSGRLEDVIGYLNKFLALDGYELQQQGSNARLLKRGTSAPAIASLAATLAIIDFDTVQRDLDRALASVETDPEDTVTAACSVIESLCRSILSELDLPLPAQFDIQGLYKAVREPLGLAPGKEDMPSDIANDVRAILGNLNAAVQGIGALRIHAGDAHGRGRGFRRIDARIARLAIHASSGIALFIIETGRRNFRQSRSVCIKLAKDSGSKSRCFCAALPTDASSLRTKD